MKKIFSILLAVAATLGIATSCSDIPMPYDINNGTTSFGKALPYKSASLYTGWSTHKLTDYDPWSQGSSYTQATGYQKWDNSDTKTNKQVEGYLISPAINTTCESGKVKVTFDHCIGYSSNDSDYKNHIGFYVSKNYDGTNFDEATWTKLDFPITAAACNSTWTLVNVGDIQLPDSLVNVDGVYFAFYMKSASDSKSITWEPMNFYVMEGEASASSDDADSTSVAGTKEAPLTVSEAAAKVGSMGYVSGYIVGYVDGTKLEEGAKFEAAAASETEVLLADAADCTDATMVFPVQLPSGDIRTALNPATASNIGKKVTVYGSIETYFGTTGMKSTSWASIDGKTVGTDPDAPVVPAADPKGTGTAADPYNVSGVNKFTSAGSYSNSSPSAEVYVTGIVSKVGDLNSNYGELNYYISDDGTTNNQFYVYNGYGLNGEKITSTDYLKVGDKVVICGKAVTFSGTNEFTYGSKIISLNGKTEGGTTTDDSNKTTGSSEGLSIDGTTVTLTNSAVTAGTKSVTLDLSTLGFENAAAVETVSFSDGATLTFAAGTNTNAPKYYTATNGVRVYANNTLTFTGTANIAKIEMTCDAYNGTNYVGNETATVSFDGKTAVYTNASTTAGTQLRVKTITITYSADASAAKRRIARK